MLKWNVQQMLGVLLSGLLIHPAPMSAEPVMSAPPAAVLGSITSYGSVYVGDVSVPSESTLFAGDQVSTRLGSAVIQYKEGARVLLAVGSEAQFTADQAQLQKGQMTFRAVSKDGPTFAASSLRLEPAAANSSASVTLNDGKASVAVTEGAVRVVDPSGARLASLQAGEARLFAMASPAASAPAAPSASAAAAAPQAGGMSGNKVWLLALGVAVVGTSLGIAGLVRASDADERAEASATAAAAAQTSADQLRTLVTTLQSQNAALQTQLTALQGQLATLRAQVAAFTASAAQQAALLRQLEAAAAQAEQIQTQINQLQAQINQAVAAGNIPLLNSLIGQQNALVAALAALATTISNLARDLGLIPSSPILP